MANRFCKTLFILTYISVIYAFNDVKLSQIINIANKLPISDCRRIVASLDFDLFEFPESATSAANKLPRETSCLDLLTQWRSGIGQIQNHTILVRRLKQTGYEDLANWLAKSVFTRSSDDEETFITEVYETETFTFEPETESWTEYDVVGSNKTAEVGLDTDAADLFAEILALMAGIVAILWGISKVLKKCQRKHPEDLPLRSSKY